MKIVILDGYTENPGDLSWEGFERLGGVTLYDRTPVKDVKEIENRIGQAVGRLANAFGMKILAYAVHRRLELETDVCRYTELEELFAQSDIISLHCPLFPATEGLVNKESISRMKDGVVILNTGRGPLIVEQDLADALNCGKVYAAGLDVVSTEPIRKDNPLLTAKNCLITPHIAWASKESRQRLMDTAVRNLESFLAGKPMNVVNL